MPVVRVSVCAHEEAEPGEGDHQYDDGYDACADRASLAAPHD
jgi:hypothetical protein